MVLQTNASLTSAPMMNKKYTIPFVLLFTTLALGKDLCDVDSGDYSFTLGEWSVSVLRDGDFKNPESFVLQPAFIVQHFFDFYYPGVTPTASFNPVLLRKDKEVFLFDSGNAVGRVPTAGLLISQLESVGVKPEDVTRIFITHAHPDHTGGLVASNGGRVYPNARIYVSVVENDFWTLPYPEIQKQIPDVPEVFINSTFEAYNAAAKAYGNRIQKINDRETPIPGIQALFTPGDTPGHTSYRISSGKKTLTIFGDVVLGRTSNVQHPEWNLVVDSNRTEAVHTRFSLLGKLAEEGGLAIIYHETFPGIGYIVRDKASFDFSPVARLGNHE